VDFVGWLMEVPVTKDEPLPSEGAQEVQFGNALGAWLKFAAATRSPHITVPGVALHYVCHKCGVFTPALCLHKANEVLCLECGYEWLGQDAVSATVMFKGLGLIEYWFYLAKYACLLS
jgi:hypothetical protein